MKTRSVLECGGWRGTGLTPLSFVPRRTLNVECWMFPQHLKAACVLTSSALAFGFGPTSALEPRRSAAETDGPPRSKGWRRLAALALLALSTLNLQLSTAKGQNYSLDWSTIDGGGGTSTGGVYAVTGTIGQPDAGAPLTNGQYSVTGGFWALPLAVQTPAAPTLTIAPTAPGFALISWTPNTPGFVLQETHSLAPTNWVASPSSATNPVVVPATLPSKFYRLHRP